jgi:hypothetical protein
MITFHIKENGQLLCFKINSFEKPFDINNYFTTPINDPKLKDKNMCSKCMRVKEALEKQNKK